MKTRRNIILKKRGTRKMKYKNYCGKKWVSCVEDAKKKLYEKGISQPNLENIKKLCLKKPKTRFAAIDSDRNNY
jgi:hypothetical protein